MGRLLAVDFGERRIGTALSDPTHTIASPHATLVRRRGKRPPWADLLRIVQEYEVEALVIGLPLDLSGEEGEWAEEVRTFGDQLARRTGLVVHWIDERLSSVRAERTVRSIGLPQSRREQKERVDAAAAAVILQTFLSRQRGASTEDAVSTGRSEENGETSE